MFTISAANIYYKNIKPCIKLVLNDSYLTAYAEVSLFQSPWDWISSNGTPHSKVKEAPPPPPRLKLCPE